jgi:spore germination protein YaaH
MAVNAAMVEDVLTDAKLRAAHVKALTEVATRSKYTGIMVDYRGLAPESRAAFTKFIADLARSTVYRQQVYFGSSPPLYGHSQLTQTVGTGFQSNALEPQIS